MSRDALKIVALGILCGWANLAAACPADGERPPPAECRKAWVALLSGVDWTELPDKDGPEILAGLAIGYDHFRGRKFLGIEAEVGHSNARKFYSGYRDPSATIDVHYGRDLYIGLRPGYRIGRNILAYAKGGYLNSYLRYTYQGPPQFSRAFGRPGALDAFVAGAGLEYDLPRGWLIKSEYRYANFHDGLYRHQAAIGVGFRF